MAFDDRDLHFATQSDWLEDQFQTQNSKFFQFFTTRGVVLEHIYGKVTFDDPGEYPYQLTGVT